MPKTREPKEFILINTKPGKLAEVKQALKDLGLTAHVVAGEIIHAKYDLVIPTGHDISDIDNDARNIFKIPGIARVLVEFKS